MAKTIQEGFNDLQYNLNITNLQESTVSERQQIIRRVIESEIVVLDSFLMGSYKRHTLIAPLSKADVDIFVVLDPKYFDKNGPIFVLEILRRVLKATYNTSAIRPDGQAVTITFEDFKVDIVPGFNNPINGYLIPDTSYQTWVPTDPTKHIEVWAGENRSHNGKLVPLLKMIKGWNTKNNILKSFHLETLSLQLLREIKITDYSLAVAYIFDKGREQVKLPTYDEAGYGGNTGEYLALPMKMAAAVSAFEIAYERAISAKDLETRGMTYEAFQKWRLIFDEYFPSYG